MGLRRKDNGRAPGAAASTDPAVGEEGVKLVEDDLGFVGAVVRRAATHRLAGTGINTKFEATDALGDTSFIERIPVAHDNGGKLTTDGLGDGSADAEVLIEFGLVDSGVPEAEVGTWRELTDFRGKAKGSAIPLKNEVAVIERVVVSFRIGLEPITRFGTPDFGRAFDAMDTSGDSEVGRRDGSSKRPTVMTEVKDRNDIGVYR